MRLSVKNMIISFVAALIVFSVMMTVICVSIYRERIAVRLADPNDTDSTLLPIEAVHLPYADAFLYYELDKASELCFATLVIVDDKNDEILLTPLDGTLPVYYRDGIYFVSSIYKEKGPDILPDISAAITGIYPETAVKLESNKSEDREDFLAQVKQLLVETDRYRGYAVSLVEVISDVNGVADHQKTVMQFLR